MGVTWSQFFPPVPTLTEANLPAQTGKVFIVTGGYSGVGLAMAKILYNAGATVYVAGRSKDKFDEATKEITAALKESSSSAGGKLEFLHLELDDLPSVRKTVDEFKSKESRLDALFNNAAVSLPPKGSLGTSGEELMLATNVLGPFLLTQLLIPCLEAAAASSPPASVRVVWTTSIVVDLQTPKGGFPIADLHTMPADQQMRYTHTKLGNWYLAYEFGERLKDKGILSVAQNPGNLRTNLTRHMPAIVPTLVAPLLYQPNYGAYTALYAGLSDDLTMDDSGAYLLPWGRLHPAPREDLLEGLKSTEDGGTGHSAEFWDFCSNATSGQ